MLSLTRSPARRLARALVWLTPALAACGSDTSSADASGGAGGAGGSGGATAGTQADAGTGGSAGDAGGGGGAGGAGGAFTPDAATPDAGAPVPPGQCAPPADAPCEGDDPDLRPGRLNEHTAVYDTDRHEMIVFGGNDAIPIDCGFPDYTYHADTWIFRDYDDTCARWSHPEGDAPPGRGRHAAAYGAGAMWVYGGRGKLPGGSMNVLFDDLWKFETATRTWTRIDAAGGPGGRMNATLVHDAARNALLLFGGNAGSAVSVDLRNDVWRFDIAAGTWSRVETSGEAPRARLFHAAFYDTMRDRMVVFGGADENLFSNNARYFSDLLALDLQTGAWTTLANGSTARMQGRFWAGLVHDTVHDHYVVFGGHDDQTLGNRNDVYLYDPTRDRWLRESEGDTFNKPANGPCDFPIDFVNVEAALPERRNAHSLVWSDCGHAVLFGGKTDCGAINDVWRYDGQTWTEAQAADEGEACLRFRNNPDNCQNLCF